MLQGAFGIGLDAAKCLDEGSDKIGVIGHRSSPRAGVLRSVGASGGTQDSFAFGSEIARIARRRDAHAHALDLRRLNSV